MRRPPRAHSTLPHPRSPPSPPPPTCPPRPTRTQVTDHEGAVIELFTGLLSASACKPLENGWPYYCAGGLTPELIAGRTLKVLDYGSNAGFFGQLSARFGYDTVIVEPQPHCVQYIRAATALNGVHSKLTINHAFLSAGGRTPAGEAQLPLPRRTGCMGTWPLPLESKVRQYYDSLPGGNDTVMVPVIDPPCSVPLPLASSPALAPPWTGGRAVRPGAALQGGAHLEPHGGVQQAVVRAGAGH